MIPIPSRFGDLIVIGSEYAPHGSAPHAGRVLLTILTCDWKISTCSPPIASGSWNITATAVFIPAVASTGARPRAISSNAILPGCALSMPTRYHSKHAIRGPTYLNCKARYMADDCVNICGDYHIIMSSKGRTLRVLAKGGMNIQSGDPVELVLYTGERLSDAKVELVQKPMDRFSTMNEPFCRNKAWTPGLKSGRGLSKAYAIILDREVNIAARWCYLFRQPNGQRLCCERLRLRF